MVLTGYVAAGAAIIILGLGIGLAVQTNRLDTTQNEFQEYKTQVETLAKLGKQRNLKRKAQADAETKRLRSNLATSELRLREQIAASRFGSPVTGRPDLTCFDRAEFDGAIRRFVEGAGVIAGKGQSATVDLNTAKQWAQQN